MDISNLEFSTADDGSKRVFSGKNRGWDDDGDGEGQDDDDYGEVDVGDDDGLDDDGGRQLEDGGDGGETVSLIECVLVQ